MDNQTTPLDNLDGDNSQCSRRRWCSLCVVLPPSLDLCLSSHHSFPASSRPESDWSDTVSLMAIGRQESTGWLTLCFLRSLPKIRDISKRVRINCIANHCSPAGLLPSGFPGWSRMNRFQDHDEFLLAICLSILRVCVVVGVIGLLVPQRDICRFKTHAILLV
jgi:hypothetical protein